MDPIKTSAEHDADAEKIKEYFAFYTILVDKLAYRNTYFVVTHSVYDNRDIYRMWTARVEGEQVHVHAETTPVILQRPDF